MNPDSVVLEEVQVLEAIYAAQFRKKSSHSFNIDLAELGLECSFSLPSEYPQVVPKVSITAPNRIDSIALTKFLLQRAEGMLGEPMIFNLVALISDHIQDFIVSAPRLKLETSTTKVSQEPEYTAIETRKIEEGTLVTKESFLKWHSSYIDQHDPEAFQITRNHHHGKLTGRQLFEQRIIKWNEEEELEADEAAFDVGAIDQALFVDLDGLSGSDEEQ